MYLLSYTLLLKLYEHIHIKPLCSEAFSRTGHIIRAINVRKIDKLSIINMPSAIWPSQESTHNRHASRNWKAQTISLVGIKTSGAWISKTHYILRSEAHISHKKLNLITEERKLLSSASFPNNKCNQWPSALQWPPSLYHLEISTEKLRNPKTHAKKTVF